MALPSSRVAARLPRVEILSGAADLATVEASITDLAADACEPNPFFEPGFLRAAFEAGDGRHPTRLLLVREPCSDTALLLLPLASALLHDRVPWRIGTAWVSPSAPHAYLGTPLVRRRHETRALDALLDHLDQIPGSGLLELREFATDRPFAHVLRQRLAARGQPWLDLGVRDRAVFRPRDTAEAYITAALSHARRRKLAQLRRQLERHGTLSFTVLAPDADAMPWIESFLALEAAGWKGQSGTALASTEAGRRFFTSLARTFHADGRLVMYRLDLDGAVIAQHCGLRAAADRRALFAYKIAYDETFARQSPGLQLELEAMPWLHAPEAGVREVDSCAGPNQALWRELWLDRLQLGHLLIGARRPGARLCLRALGTARQARQELRQASARIAERARKLRRHAQEQR